MNRILIIVKRNMELVVTLIAVAAIFLFVDLKQRNVKKDGTITIAKVIEYQGAASGSDLYIDIYLGDKVYSTSIGYGCSSECVGKYFFIKVDRKNPKDYPIFYGDKQVPECLLSNTKFHVGWDDFPTCP